MTCTAAPTPSRTGELLFVTIANDKVSDAQLEEANCRPARNRYCSCASVTKGPAGGERYPHRFVRFQIAVHIGVPT